MNGKERKDIRSFILADIAEFFRQQGEKPFRARQVYAWLWRKNCRSFGEMTNLSVHLRQQLDENFVFPVVSAENELKSSDGTIKTAFRLPDGYLVEGVLIPNDGRTTACISSQVGCPLACTFCATGILGFKRNLSFTEIFDQVVLINRQSLANYRVPVSNVVYMGMGEPLLNFDEVLKSVEKITSPEGLGMSPQRITVSSVGIPKMIRQMGDQRVSFHFALSLHAANNEKRNRIIPLNKKYPLEELTESLKYYHQKTKKRFTVEYILFRDFNDSLQDARDLALFCKNFPVKINIIEYNPVPGVKFLMPDPLKVRTFTEFLEKKNMVVNIRKSRGKDIAAACGQLAGKLTG